MSHHILLILDILVWVGRWENSHFLLGSQVFSSLVTAAVYNSTTPVHSHPPYCSVWNMEATTRQYRKQQPAKIFDWLFLTKNARFHNIFWILF